MKNENVKKLSLALGLTRRIVGVKFIFIKEEYDDIDLPEFKNKTTFCAMSQRAMKGEMLKANAKCFTCQGGPETFGMVDVDNYVSSGKQFSTFKLYESAAVSRQAQESITFIKQRIYGIVAGPLDEMEDADVVMFLANGRQMMRVIQGYTYRFGMAKNIGMIGNQGICSDLIARPYQLNDMNISVMCYGARMHTKADDGELGAGLPINLFDDLVTGVIETVNSALGNPEKRELIERLSSPDELGIEIEFGKMYGSYTKDAKYDESLYRRKPE